MKKILLALLLLLAIRQTSHASLIVEDIYKKVKVDSATYNQPFGPVTSIFTFNYFQIPGSFSITGKLNVEVNSMLLADPIGGGNYHPTLLYNNTNWNSRTNFVRSPIFIQNNSLTFTNQFQGKGNNYVGGRLIFASGDTIYFWMLLNLNEAGNELYILKMGYDDVSGVRPVTGNEGQNNPNPTGIDVQEAPVLNVYPQPAKDQLFLSLPASEVMDVQVTNLKGELVYRSQFTAQVDLLNWPAGIYLMQVETRKGILTRKVLVE